MRAVGSPLTRLHATISARLLQRRTQRIFRRQGVDAAAASVVHGGPRSKAALRVWCSRNGLEWCLDLTDVAQRLLFATGSYEALLVRFLSERLGPDSNVLDIGAHVGLLTVPLAKHLAGLGGAGHVFSFEPSPDSQRYLRENVEANNVAARVSVVNAAVGAAPGSAELRSTAKYGESSSTRSLRGTGRLVATVEVVSIDDWWRSVGTPPIDIVKVDVEGGELDVLTGMRGLLESGSPHTLLVECKQELSQTFDTSIEQIEAFLGAVGYDRQPPISQLVGLDRRLPHIDDNVVFTRR